MHGGECIADSFIVIEHDALQSRRLEFQTYRLTVSLRGRQGMQSVFVLNFSGVPHYVAFGVTQVLRVCPQERIGREELCFNILSDEIVFTTVPEFR